MHIYDKTGLSSIEHPGIDNLILAKNSTIITPSKKKKKNGLLRPSLEGHDRFGTGKKPLWHQGNKCLIT